MTAISIPFLLRKNYMFGAVHHVSLNVHNLKEVLPFYTETLQMTEKDRPDFGFPGAWLTTPGGSEIHLIQVDGWTAPKGQHFSIQVHNIDNTVTYLREHNIKINDPIYVPGTTIRQAFFKDPSGNLIEITQPHPQLPI